MVWKEFYNKLTLGLQHPSLFYQMTLTASTLEAEALCLVSPVPLGYARAHPKPVPL